MYSIQKNFQRLSVKREGKKMNQKILIDNGLAWVCNIIHVTSHFKIWNMSATNIDFRNRLYRTNTNTHNQCILMKRLFFDFRRSITLATMYLYIVYSIHTYIQLSLSFAYAWYRLKCLLALSLFVFFFGSMYLYVVPCVNLTQSPYSHSYAVDILYVYHSFSVIFSYTLPAVRRLFFRHILCTSLFFHFSFILHSQNLFLCKFGFFFFII